MNIDIPMRTTKPMDCRSLYTRYGPHNTHTKIITSNPQSIASYASGDAPSGTFGTGSSSRTSGTGSSGRTSGTGSSSRASGTGSIGSASNPSYRLPHRQHPPRTGVLLKRGQKFSLKDNRASLTEITIGLGWDVTHSECELDASAFLLGSQNKVPSDEWLVFYGQPVSPDQSVTYSVVNGNISSGDDAELKIQLKSIQPQIQKIVFSVTIYEAFSKNLHFGMVKNLYARIVDTKHQKEIARFEMEECYPNVTAMVVGELYRHQGEWKFNAVGSGVRRDLAEFCNMYGVAIES